MTTKLEQTLADAGFPHISSVLSIRLMAAARLDAEDAYRRGVEDARMITEAARADRMLWLARDHHQRGAYMNFCRAFAIKAKNIREKAFNGIRGIERLEIRQRFLAATGSHKK